MFLHRAQDLRLRRSRQRRRHRRRHADQRDHSNWPDSPRRTAPSTRSSSRSNHDRHPPRPRLRHRLGPLRSAVGRRPYPIWEDLRQRCPVAHTDRYGGGWFPATHAGVSEIAKDTENFTSRTVVIGNGRPTELDLPAPIGVAPPITSDPPFHAIARRLILPAFAPGPINALEPMIRELCSSLLDGLAGEDVVNAGTRVRAVHPAGRHPRDVGLPRRGHRAVLRVRPHHHWRASTTPKKSASSSSSRSRSTSSPRSKTTWTTRATT